MSVASLLLRLQPEQSQFAKPEVEYQMRDATAPVAQPATLRRAIGLTGMTSIVVYVVVLRLCVVLSVLCAGGLILLIAVGKNCNWGAFPLRQ